MKKRYTTESGSIYTIDFENKTWERIKGVGATEIRSDSGTFDDISFEGPYGRSIIMICPPYKPGNPPVPRVITSTRIILEEDWYAN